MRPPLRAALDNVLATSGDDFLIRELVGPAPRSTPASSARPRGLTGRDEPLTCRQSRALLASHRASQGLLDGGGAGRIVDRMLERVSAGSVEAAGRA